MEELTEWTLKNKELGKDIEKLLRKWSKSPHTNLHIFKIANVGKMTVADIGRCQTRQSADIG